jgi:hypothetical protein
MSADLDGMRRSVVWVGRGGRAGTYCYILQRDKEEKERKESGQEGRLKKKRE